MSTAAKGAGGILYELVGDVIHFPLWWYTSGIAYICKSAVQSAQNYARSLAIAVWLRNIFVPMYGQYDWQSRIISVFMRTVQIAGRGLFLLLYVTMLILGVLCYVAAPLVAGAFVIFHLFGSLLT